MNGDETDYSDIPGKNLDSFLDRQLETYFHTQERAERLIQLLIASTAVIAAFSSPGLVSFVQSAITYLENNQEILQIIGGNRLLSNVALFGIPISIFILLIGIALILESIAWSVNVLTVPKLRPVLGSNKEYSTDLPKVKKEDLEDLYSRKGEKYANKIREDLKYNTKVLDLSEEYLRSSYQSLIGSLVAFLFFIIFAVSGISRAVLIISVFCGLVSLYGVALAAITGKDLILDNDQTREQFRSILVGDYEKLGLPNTHMPIYFIIIFAVIGIFIFSILAMLSIASILIM